MAQLTQVQIAEKYGSTAPDVSFALKEGCVDPVGTIQGPKRLQNVYDEDEAKKALVGFYTARANKYYAKYQYWTEKVNSIGGKANGKTAD